MYESALMAVVHGPPIVGVRRVGKYAMFRVLCVLAAAADADGSNAALGVRRIAELVQIPISIIRDALAALVDAGRIEQTAPAKATVHGTVYRIIPPDDSRGETPRDQLSTTRGETPRDQLSTTRGRSPRDQMAKNRGNRAGESRGGIARGNPAQTRPDHVLKPVQVLRDARASRAEREPPPPCEVCGAPAAVAALRDGVIRCATCRDVNGSPWFMLNGSSVVFRP